MKRTQQPQPWPFTPYPHKNSLFRHRSTPYVAAHRRRERVRIINALLYALPAVIALTLFLFGLAHFDDEVRKQPTITTINSK